MIPSIEKLYESIIGLISENTEYSYYELIGVLERIKSEAINDFNVMNEVNEEIEEDKSFGEKLPDIVEEILNGKSIDKSKQKLQNDYQDLIEFCIKENPDYGTFTMLMQQMFENRMLKRKLHYQKNRSE